MRATRVALLIPSFLLALNLASVQAATFYWDTDGTSTGDSTSTGAGLGGTASWSTATPARLQARLLLPRAERAPSFWEASTPSPHSFPSRRERFQLPRLITRA